MELLSLNAIGIFAGSLALAMLLLYHAAKPKPIPGIPYDEKSSRRLLGDLPDALSFKARTGELPAFFGSRCEQLGSPIVQLFLRPFTNPVVVVCDSREVFDILHRRRDVDQSDLFIDNFIAAWPNASGTMKTGEQFKYNRRLVAEMMSPGFLRDVDAPIAHEAVTRLMDLWRQKAKLAEGRAFNAREDFSRMTNDIIWKVLLGQEIDAVGTQLRYLSSMKQVILPPSLDQVAELPEGEDPQEYTAFRLLLASSTIPRSALLGRWQHEIAVHFYPRLSWAFRLKNALVKKQANDAWHKFKDSDLKSHDSVDKRQVRSAVEHVIQREVRAAKKEGRTAEGPSKWIQGELASMLAAGYDTTASSTSWAVKYITLYQDVQRNIRASLHKAFPQALAEKRQPTSTELYNTPLLYLDAVIEEIFRCSTLIPAVSRTITTNTQILGHDIPANTIIVLKISPQHCATRQTPRPSEKTTPTKPTALSPISESLRTASSKEYAPMASSWDDSDLQHFRPERYLAQKDGKDVLDLAAGPHVTFGGGSRGCFGKKMAYLNLRIILALMIWNFELEQVPEGVAGFEPLEAITIEPKHVFARLREVVY